MSIATALGTMNNFSLSSGFLDFNRNWIELAGKDNIAASFQKNLRTPQIFKI